MFVGYMKQGGLSTDLFEVYTYTYYIYIYIYTVEYVYMHIHIRMYMLVYILCSFCEKIPHTIPLTFLMLST